MSWYINSKESKQVLCNKFEIDFKDVYLDVGIQKYLNGYEISPHPDVRKKALTFMININPGINSEEADFHTHYLRFIDSKKYIYDFWKYNNQFDRCWVHGIGVVLWHSKYKIIVLLFSFLILLQVEN